MRQYLLVFVLAFAARIPAAAQVLYGSLTGNVRDAAGGMVSGAAVKLRNVGTGQELTERTNDAGSYTFSSLSSGTYDLTVGAVGFRSLTQRGISISVNDVRREDVALEVGQLSESITVQAGQVALQTDKADVHTELGSKDFLNMPLPHYRNYQSLINLVPGATPGQFQNSIQAAPGRALS